MLIFLFFLNRFFILKLIVKFWLVFLLILPDSSHFSLTTGLYCEAVIYFVNL